MAKKYEPYSRRELRRRQGAWRRRNWRRLTVATAVFVATGVLVTAVFMTIGAPSSFRWYFIGVFHAAMVATYYWFTSVAVLASDQNAIRHLRGAWGEENTREELKSAKRRRAIWDSVDSISFQNGDLDHVVVTRRAGLVVLDSKWRNQATTDDRAEILRAAQRTKLRCQSLAAQELGKERGAKHRARADAFSVRCAVVVWGALQGELGEPREVDGVDIVPGQKLVAWLRSLDGDPVSKSAAREAVERLREYRAKSWEAAAQEARRAGASSR
jgi:hypothetical protein